MQTFEMGVGNFSYSEKGVANAKKMPIWGPKLRMLSEFGAKNCMILK